MSFYVYALDEWTECASLAQALETCRAAISEFGKIARMSGEWPSEVEDICISEGPAGLDREAISDLRALMVAAEVNHAFPDGTLDEDGYDEAGEYFGDCDYRCDIGMVEFRK